MADHAELRSGLKKLMGGFDPDDDGTAATLAQKKQRKASARNRKKRMKAKAAQAKKEPQSKAEGDKKAQKAKKGKKAKKAQKAEHLTFEDAGKSPTPDGDYVDMAEELGAEVGDDEAMDDATVRRLADKKQLISYAASEGEGANQDAEADEAEEGAGVAHWYELKGANDKIPLKRRPKRVDPTVATALAEEADELLKEDERVWHAVRTQSGRAEAKWMAQVIKSGTLKDKVAAMSLMVQEGPVHTLSHIRGLVAMASKKSRREAGLAIDALRDLFTLTLLPPSRPLRLFVEQPGLYSLVKRKEKKHGGKLSPEDKRLVVLWWFEAQLKVLVGQYVATLTTAVNDDLEHHKSMAIKAAAAMLEKVPEKEKQCMALVVGKLGDKNRRVASKVVHLIHTVLQAHPNMKAVFIAAISKFMRRSTITAKARYYAAVCLNQIVLQRGDTATAAALISTYFTMFKISIEDGDVETRLLSALLTGVNRAFPYSSGDDTQVEEQADQLFKVSHIGTFSTRVQALSLLFQVMNTKSTLSDRFYRALYAALLAPELGTTNKAGLFLNLLYRAMKADSSSVRVRAFAKRVLQVCHHMPAGFSAGALYLVSEVIRSRPDLLSIVTQKEVSAADFGVAPAVSDSEEEEEAGKAKASSSDSSDSDSDSSSGSSSDSDSSDSSDSDSDEASGGGKSSTANELSAALSLLDSKVLGSEGGEDGGEAAGEEVAPGSTSHKNDDSTEYDPYHRDPQFCHADKAALWELPSLLNYVHPSVAKFAELILASPAESLNYGGDPLHDFSLMAFLDRFVYKNPKKRKSKHGGSAMRSKYSAKEGEQPVNSASFVSQIEEEVAPNEMFFYQFFKKQQQRQATAPKKKKRRLNSEDEEAAEEAYAQKLAESLMDEADPDADVDDDDFNYTSSEDEEGKAGPGGDGDDDEEEDGEDYNFDFGEGSDDDEGEQPAASGRDSENVFADAEEFAELLETAGESDVNPKQRAWEGRNSGKARGNKFSGKGRGKGKGRGTKRKRR